jgi:hypothetical protein
MLLSHPSLLTIIYCGKMKICPGTIICSNTMVNSTFFPGNSSLAKAKAARALKNTEPSTRSTIMAKVL